MTRFALILSLLAPGVATAQDHLGHMWSSDKFPVPWEISDYDEESLPEGYPQQMHQTAFDEWNRSAPCAGMSAEVVDVVDANTPFTTTDFKNRITFDDPGDELAPGVLAANVTFPPAGLGAVLAVKNGRSYTQALDSDIVYNDNVTWTTAEEAEAGSCASGSIVMWNTAVHEIGHSYGMKHTCEQQDVCTDPLDIEATMMWTNTGPTCSLERGTPNERDVFNMTTLYGPFASFSCSHELSPGSADTIAVGIVDSEEGFELKCLAKSDDPEAIKGATWYFGDGGVDESIDGTHVYEEPGNYTLRVCFDIEQDSCGETQYCFRRDGYVRACAQPEPIFELRHIDGRTYDFRNETDLSVYGCIYEVQWDVFNANGENIASINSWEPEYVFPEDGDYRVVLNIGGPAGTGAAELAVDIRARRGQAAAGCSTTGPGLGLGWLSLVGLLSLRRRRSV